METQCPRCDQRLRYPDDVFNPRLRCKACGETFRPSESAESEPSAARWRDEEPSRQSVDSRRPLEPLHGGRDEPTYEGFDEPSYEPTEMEPEDDEQFEEFLENQRRDPAQPAARNSGAGWGIVIMVLVMGLSRAPSLLRLFKDDRPPRNVPARNDQHLRDLQRNLDQLRLQQRPQFVPPDNDQQEHVPGEFGPEFPLQIEPLDRPALRAQPALPNPLDDQPETDDPADDSIAEPSPTEEPEIREADNNAAEPEN